VAVFGLLAGFLRFTRWGLIVRAGVENRNMVSALGIDVQRAFTLVFTIGGVAAALGGALGAVYFGNIDPERGTSTLIFAFIVIVIGGLGSLSGSAVAAVVVGLLQQFANYYASVFWGFSAAGDPGRGAAAGRRSAGTSPGPAGAVRMRQRLRGADRGLLTGVLVVAVLVAVPFL